jgi:5-formyltetrahydrofolate cyclo-ligase
VLFYAPLPGELDLWPLAADALAGGKTVALPRFVPARRSYIACQVQDLERDLEPGHFGIREPGARCPPILLNGLDLLLVPGVAFDLHGRRLGRGKGFYDQLLAGVRGLKCGVAFEQQLVDAVPAGRNDVCMNCILTPTRWVQW